MVMRPQINWGPPRWVRWLRLLVVLAAVFGFIVGAVVVGIKVARADDSVIVQVDDAVKDATRVRSRIESQMLDHDEIAVIVTADNDRQYLGQFLGSYYTDRVLLLAIGDDVWVRGNDWIKQEFLDDALPRVQAVNRRPVDRIIGMIHVIHQWQTTNPRPTPPPPPPTPPGPPKPPPPPPGPSFWDFHWWNWAWGWAPITFGVLFVLWLPLEIRRRRRIAEYRRRADEQADWGVDEYGIKTTID